MPMEGRGVLVIETPLHVGLASVSAYVRKSGGSEREREWFRERVKERERKGWHVGCSRHRVCVREEGEIEVN